jgi:hypothetical protein
MSAVCWLAILLVGAPPEPPGRPIIVRQNLHRLALPFPPTPEPTKSFSSAESATFSSRLQRPLPHHRLGHPLWPLPPLCDSPNRDDFFDTPWCLIIPAIEMPPWPAYNDR